MLKKTCVEFSVDGMDKKAAFESAAMVIKRYGNHVGYNTYQFREFQLHEADDESVIRFGYAMATLDPKTGEVYDKTDLLKRAPRPWMAHNDDSEVFDGFAEAICRKGSITDFGLKLGTYAYQRTSLGQHASMETITDHRTSNQAVKMVVDENGFGRVFLRYLGFDQDSFSRAYDEINCG